MRLPIHRLLLGVAAILLTSAAGATDSSASQDVLEPVSQPRGIAHPRRPAGPHDSPAGARDT
jgi:hypothetical protein